MTVTLAEIERETARRVGPFYEFTMDRQVPTTAGFERAFFPGLRSNVEQDLVTNLWLLRRGINWQGAPVTVPADDRQRTVATYDPSQGAVGVDRPWSVAPAPGEVCEFHHLDPEQALRPSVLGGLRRTIFEDRYMIGPEIVYEADLTAALPWLVNQKLVKNVQAGPYPPTGLASTGPCDIPFTVFGQSGHVCIRISGSTGPFTGGLLITIWHPHFNFVNGADTTVGPTADDDELDMDLDYAAAAGHIEAWHLFPPRLAAAAAGGMQATQQMAAFEFTRQMFINAPEAARRFQFSGGFSVSGGLPLVVNA